MKKLLSILATLGITTASGVTAISFSGEETLIQNEKTEADEKGEVGEGVDAISTDVTFDLKQTKGGNNPLAEQDQQELYQLIVQELINVNQEQAANVNEDTFVFDLIHATTKTTNVFVKVKSTFSSADLPGLNSGQVTVGLTLKPLVQDAIDPVGSEVKLILKETQSGKTLTETDKTDLHDTIVDALIKANRNALVTEDIFEFTLDELTPESTLVNVNVLPTTSTPDKPGVNAKEVEVKLQLFPANQQAINAVGGAVNFALTNTRIGETLDSEDQKSLTDEINAELSEKNKNAAIEADTFKIETLANIVPDKPTSEVDIKVNVNPTLSTPDKPGLNLGSVEVKATLTAANLGMVDVKGAQVTYDLQDQSEENLSERDQTELRKKIIGELLETNKETTATEDTFDFGLDKINYQSKSIIIHAKETPSNAEKSGLNDSSAEVKLSLNLPVLEKVDVVVPSTIEFSLSETHLGENLSSEDKQKLYDEIVRQFLSVNPNTTATEDTFTFNLNEIKVSDELVELPVIVNETESTNKTPGLNGDTITVNLHLTAQVLDPVQAQKFNLKLQLAETKEGEELTEKDKEFVREEIIKELLKVNAHTTATAESFEIDLEGIIPGNYSYFEVKVLATPSTKEKPGLKAEIIKNQLVLVPNR